MPVTLPTTKLLFAKSRNQCAFDGCNRPLVHDDGVVVGRICHIKASSKRGPRYDQNQSDEERHGYKNLVLLCPEHHDVIDRDVNGEWTVERLVAMKISHESSAVSDVNLNDTDRITRQLIENQAIYQQGIQIGSVVANNVNIAHGDIVFGPTPAIVNRAVEEDLATLERIRTLLGGNTLRFMREHDFGNSFDGHSDAPLQEFYYQDGPEHEFINEQVEAERKQLHEAVGKYLEERAIRTFQQDLSSRYRINQEREFENKKDRAAFQEYKDQIARDREILNSAAGTVASTYERLIRFARKTLGAGPG